jgi:hypothetical protein
MHHEDAGIGGFYGLLKRALGLTTTNVVARGFYAFGAQKLEQWQTHLA